MLMSNFVYRSVQFPGRCVQFLYGFCIEVYSICTVLINTLRCFQAKAPPIVVSIKEKYQRVLG